ncbi:hypothetical protein GALMADRAFT_1208605 [Galerina marginata CBS 339.88]|uniref:Uncharacterized protein n=1 Tax=Galerina marginata (strain CBS 339.88) TaxID=685588 RepID=A0A067S5L9_GALM3|nr:hypothetical protein GALMADRAFT_1208605 [Galerina marginata CBS 339.88]
MSRSASRPAGDFPRRRASTTLIEVRPPRSSTNTSFSLPPSFTSTQVPQLYAVSSFPRRRLFTPSTRELCLCPSRCGTTTPLPTNVSRSEGPNDSSLLVPPRRLPSLSFLSTLPATKPPSLTLLHESQLHDDQHLVVFPGTARTSTDVFDLNFV